MTLSIGVSSTFCIALGLPFCSYIGQIHGNCEVAAPLACLGKFRLSSFTTLCIVQNKYGRFCILKELLSNHLLSIFTVRLYNGFYARHVVTCQYPTVSAGRFSCIFRFEDTSSFTLYIEGLLSNRLLSDITVQFYNGFYAREVVTC